MLTLVKKRRSVYCIEVVKGGEELEEAQFAINVLGGKLAMTFNLTYLKMLVKDK